VSSFRRTRIVFPRRTEPRYNPPVMSQSDFSRTHFLRTPLLLAAILVIAGAALISLGTAGTAKALQGAATAYVSPTPMNDGKVVYTVQPGDTLWTISAVTGVSISQLEELNNIRRDDPLVEGTLLVLAIVQPSTPEPTLAFQATETPTPLPVTGKGQICVSFFDDINGDASRNVDTEGLVAGGQISVALTDGTEVGAVTTDGIDRQCFPESPAGEYNIAAAAPEGYNPTTEMNQRRTLDPGDTVYVSFGVQRGAPGSGATESTGGGSPILAIAGIALLGIAGFILYSVFRPRRIRYY
jgi:LysM repeat protein